MWAAMVVGVIDRRWTRPAVMPLVVLDEDNLYPGEVGAAAAAAVVRAWGNATPAESPSAPLMHKTLARLGVYVSIWISDYPPTNS